MTSDVKCAMPRQPSVTSDPAVILEVRVITGTGGGPDKTIISSPPYLDPHGYRTVCAYMHPRSERGIEVLQQRAESLQVQLIPIRDRGAWDVSVIRRLLEICRQERVTVWHGHDYKSNVLGLWLRRYWPMRLVSTVHGWGVRHWKAPLFYALDRWALKYYERVICVSEDLAETCRRSGVPSERVQVIENGIEVDRFQRKRSTEVARCETGLPSRGFCVGAIGRLSSEKGFDLLIEAVRRLREKFTDLHLVIVGEGPCRHALERQIARSGLSKSVRLLGYCDNVLNVLEALDVFVLSSHREGLPNVVLEAMAAEVPVVATRVAGVPQVITDGVDGLLAEPGDIDSLTTALARCLSDGALRQRMARAGRENVVKNRSFAVRMDRMRAVYDELLRPAGHSPARGAARPLAAARD